jgi:hypothetical protein
MPPAFYFELIECSSFKFD